MAKSGKLAEETAPSIQVKSLSFAFPDGTTGLKDITLDLPAGSRTLLIGGMCGCIYCRTVVDIDA